MLRETEVKLRVGGIGVGHKFIVVSDMNKDVILGRELLNKDRQGIILT